MSYGHHNQPAAPSHERCGACPSCRRVSQTRFRFQDLIDQNTYETMRKLIDDTNMRANLRAEWNRTLATNPCETWKEHQ